jgi:hypothetical protein
MNCLNKINNDLVYRCYRSIFTECLADKAIRIDWTIWAIRDSIAARWANERSTN